MIDYSILAYAQAFYSSHGYKYIEVPWLVSKEINDITMPDGVLPYRVIKGEKEKRFIASGEQGFLYLLSKGHLPKGFAYQTTTPCMRNDNFDQTHSKYFMKNELIFLLTPKSSADEKLTEMINHAMKFFSNVGELNPNDLSLVPTALGYDINYNGVELGSYGKRQSLMGDWIYGTGVAEPRFSRMKNAFK